MLELAEKVLAEIGAARTGAMREIVGRGVTMPAPAGSG